MVAEKTLEKLHISKEAALQEMVLLTLHSKIAEFRNEMEFFERKYGVVFAEFAERLDAFSPNHAQQEVEEDYLNWRFASENFTYHRSLL